MSIRAIFYEAIYFLRRLLIRTDQKYIIESSQLTLPRSHRLPVLQRIYGNYDRYFYNFFEFLSNEFNIATIIDIGANVGDTTVAVLEKAPNFNSIAVEGASEFLRYLDINTKRFGTRVQIVDQFVKSRRMASMTYRSDGTTGGFSGTNEIELEQNFVTVEELLRMARSELIVWKSDTDGMDIPIFLENWEIITGKAQIIWLELHPYLHPTTMYDAVQFCELIERQHLVGVLFDNFGNLVNNPGGLSLSKLVNSQLEKLRPHPRLGQNTPFYFDVVAFQENTFSVEFQRRLIKKLGGSMA